LAAFYEQVHLVNRGEKMSKGPLLHSPWLIVALIIFSASTAVAQSNTCNLQLEVIEKPESGDEKETPIKNAAASFIDPESKKVIKATLKDEHPLFRNLRSATYRISIAKHGYKTTIKNFDLDCVLADASGSVTEVIFMWKGKENETMEISRRNSATAGATTDYPRSSTDSSSSVVEIGSVVARALKLVKPQYPPAANGASGVVRVQVMIDEVGNVISAKAVFGNSLLYSAAESAAKKCKFQPTLIAGIPVKVSGFIAYYFSVSH
jgi:TonB family protein